MQTARLTMVEDANRWLEIVASLPDGATRFQRELMDADVRDALDPAQAVMLAYAALVVISAGQAGTFEPWYRDKAMSLMRRTADVLAALEAKDGEALN
jgi:hypothetical protein